MQTKSSKLIVVSAFGLKKEAVASNRILGLTNSLKPHFAETTLVSMDFSTPNNEYPDVDVIPLRLSLLQKAVRKLLDLRKRKKKSTSTASIGKTEPGGLLYTFQHIWYAGGYNLPLLRFFFKTLIQVLRSKKAVLLISSGPAALLMVGTLIKKMFPARVFLISDFRDPVLNNPYTGQLKLRGFIRWIETSAVRSSDIVTAVSRGTLELLCSQPANSLVITNGLFSFTTNRAEKINRGEIFYAGSIYTDRIHSLKSLLATLSELDVFFVYAGQNSDAVKSSGSSSRVVDLGLLPKPEVLTRMAEAHILLVLKSPADRGVLTGKFFEYLQTDRPILVIGDTDEEFNEIAEKAGGVFVVPPDKEKIKETLSFLLKEYADRGVERNIDYLKQFTWEELAAKLVEKIEAQLSTS